MPDEIPLINEPKEHGEYFKFMQLYGPNMEPYIRIGEMPELPGEPERDYHEKILIRFAEELGLSEKDLVREGDKISLPEKCGYSHVGDGMCNYDSEERDLYDVFGKSKIYGKGPNMDHIGDFSDVAEDVTVLVD